MKCKGIKLLLADYADGELDKKEQTTVSQHLTECAACRQEAEQLKSVQLLLKKDLLPSPPEAFWSTLAKQTLQRIEQAQTPWWEKVDAYLQTPSYAFGLAAGALLLAALFFLVPRQTANKYHIALNAINHEQTTENNLYPGMDEELLSQLSAQELEEVEQTIDSKSNIEDESLAHQSEGYELLYQLDGHQVEYLSQQLENVTLEERNET